MDIDPALPRWIFGSVSNHFKIALDSLYLFIEGDDRNTDHLQSYVEFRMNGPIFKKVTDTEIRLDICLNLLVTTKRDQKDLFLEQTNIGIVCNAFSNAISVFKFGSESGDDQSYFNCLLMNRFGDRTLQVQTIGQIDSQLLAVQAAVEGCYRMYIEG